MLAILILSVIGGIIFWIRTRGERSSVSDSIFVSVIFFVTSYFSIGFFLDSCVQYPMKVSEKEIRLVALPGHHAAEGRFFLGVETIRDSQYVFMYLKTRGGDGKYFRVPYANAAIYQHNEEVAYVIIKKFYKSFVKNEILSALFTFHLPSYECMIHIPRGTILQEYVPDLR